MDELIKLKPDMMINISASPFDYDHDIDRIEVIRQNVLKYKMPMIYCNAVGAQTEIVFDGGAWWSIRMEPYGMHSNILKKIVAW